MLAPLKVFISYAREDQSYRQELEKILSVLEAEGIVEYWSDREILPGDDWAEAIDVNLSAADIIIFLVSLDFLASKYIRQVEMIRAMERHESGSARVIPVFIRACDWSAAPFGRLQGVPDPCAPIEEAPSKDRAWTQVAKSIREVAVPR